MSQKLDRQVAIALGWTQHENKNYDKYWQSPDKGGFEFLPSFSSSNRWVGPLLIEAQKRGWGLRVDKFDEAWEACINDHKVCAASLPEAVARAFVAASNAGKAGAP